jgi:uncharacterized protein (DUF952 family)
MATLYHIVSSEDWRKAKEQYRPLSLETEGFIHLSTREQVLETADIFFKGQHGLLLLELDLKAEDPALRWEPAVGLGHRPGQFPHYYAPLPIGAVKRVYPFEPGEEGTFEFPAKLA